MFTRSIIGATLFAAAAVSSASVFLEFDDAGLYNHIDPVGSYMSFDFDSNAYIVDRDNYGTDFGNTYPFPSYDKGFFNGFGVTSVTMTRVGDFDFVGGFFAGWGFNNAANSQTSSSITIEGWDDGSLVGSVTKSIDADGFRYVGANFASVDKLVFKNDGSDGRWWVGDSLRFNNLETVPEPASMMALGLGLAAVARRRRSK